MDMVTAMASAQPSLNPMAMVMDMVATDMVTAMASDLLSLHPMAMDMDMVATDTDTEATEATDTVATDMVTAMASGQLMPLQLLILVNATNTKECSMMKLLPY